MIVHYKQRYFFHHSFDCVSEVSHLDSLALCFTPRSSELWMHLHLVHHRSRWAPMLGRKAAVQALENQPFGEVKQGLCFPVNWGVMINEVRIVLSAYLPQQCFRDCPIGFWHCSILLGIKRPRDPLDHWIHCQSWAQEFSRNGESVIRGNHLESTSQVSKNFRCANHHTLPMKDLQQNCRIAYGRRGLEIRQLHPFLWNHQRWKWVWVKPLWKYPGEKWWKAKKLTNGCSSSKLWYCGVLTHPQLLLGEAFLLLMSKSRHLCQATNLGTELLVMSSPD